MPSGRTISLQQACALRRAEPTARRRICAALVIAIFCAGAARAQSNAELNQKAAAAFQRVFGAGVQLDFRRVALDSAARTRIRRLSGARYGDSVALHIARIGGAIAGYGIVDNVRGKEQPITYLLMVGTDVRIKDLEVLYYREAYGGEIENKAWRDQFAGKAQGDNLYIGSGIENISGATISTNAVAFGVRKLLAVFQVLQEKNLLR